MKGYRRILIRKGADWEDVTNKHAIIYGGGQGCLDMMSELQLPNVKYVIDSNEKQWGKTLILLDQIYTIESPLILKRLPLDEYYIIISSDKYADDIKKNIENLVETRNISICMKQNIGISYSLLEELLFYDSRIKRALVRTNWSQKLDRLINLFLSVTKNTFPGGIISDYISIWNSASKILFCVCIDKNFYVFSIPALYCETENALFSHNPEERERKFYFRKKYNIGNELTVYEDSAGVLLQEMADSFVDFKIEDNIRFVLERCYGLHQLEYDFTVQHEILEERYRIAAMNLKKRAPWELKRIQELDSQVRILLQNIRKMKPKLSICHGDVVCPNIVSKEGKLFFIDWEYMVLANPLYDVCSFLYNLETKDLFAETEGGEKASRKIYKRLRKYLSYYYKRECTDKEYYQAYLVMQTLECREIMRDSFYIGHIVEERFDNLLKRIKCKEI